MLESLGTCLYPAGHKRLQERAAGGCGRQRHAAAQWPPAAGGPERHQGPRRKKYDLLNRCKIPKALSELFSQRWYTSSFVRWYCSLGSWSWFPAALGNACYWTGFVTGVFIKSSSLVPKALMCEYSWLLTASSPWRLVFSTFKCFVVSIKKPKSASQTWSHSFQICCHFSAKNSLICCLREEKRCSAEPRLSYLTSLW